MARYASFCFIMGPSKGEVPVLPDYRPFGRRRVRRDAASLLQARQY